MLKLQELRAHQALVEAGIKNAVVVIDHTTPATTVNGITRPLLFPRAILKHHQPKTIAMVFAGYMSRNRKRFLARAKRHYPFAQIRRSRRGRYEATRAMDKEYFDELASARFALCPDGDFVWTYRFFEACLLRSIPIIEHECALYHGYHYLKIGDPLVYNKDKAAQNQAKAKAELML